MTISIVIPTYNRRQMLMRTLPTVFEQDLPKDEYEVVVVVDGSDDGTAEWLRGLRPPCALRVLEQPNQGMAVARNAGVNATRGRLLLFLDDDLLCSPTLLREHVAAHQNAQVAAVAGLVLIAPQSPDSLVTEWLRVYVDRFKSRMEREPVLRWLEDFSLEANISLPREVFLACGGYDPRFTREKENLELGLRLWKRGIQFRFLPTAITHHLYLRPHRDIVGTRTLHEGKNLVLICRLYPEFRPRSPLAWLVAGSSWRRLFRQLAVRLPVSPDPILSLLFWAAEKLRGVSSIRRAGIRLLQRRYSLALFRGALHEIGSWKAFQAEFGRQLPVLLYHHVGPQRPGALPELTISPKEFERQVGWLAHHGYVGIRPQDWLAWCRQGTPLPEKPVLLTFDDAYADIAEYALPILRQYGFGALVFVVTRRVGATNTWDEAAGYGTLQLMTSSQIREWAAQGIEFGSHTRTHPNLTELSPQELRSEIAGSADDLTALLGTRVASFAYTYGLYNQAAVESAQETFDLAFTCEKGLNTLRTEPHLLRRTQVIPGESLLGFACRLRWGYNPIDRLRAWLRPRTRLRGVAEFLLNRKS